MSMSDQTGGNRLLQLATAQFHYSDVIMTTIASLITSLTIVYSTVYSDADQRKHQSPASLAFVWGIHRRPVNSPHKWPVTRKMFPFDDEFVFLWWPTSTILKTAKSLVSIFIYKSLGVGLRFWRSRTVWVNFIVIEGNFENFAPSKPL